MLRDRVGGGWREKDNRRRTRLTKSERFTKQLMVGASPNLLDFLYIA